MSSSTAKQSYNYPAYSNTSGGSTYTGGQATSIGTPQLNSWANTTDRTERFYAIGQKTGHGVLDGMDKIMAFERDYNRTK